MNREITVNCPNCRAEDRTNVEVEDFPNEYHILTECVSCTEPYVIGLTVQVLIKARTGTVDMEKTK